MAEKLYKWEGGVSGVRLADLRSKLQEADALLIGLDEAYKEAIRHDDGTSSVTLSEPNQSLAKE